MKSFLGDVEIGSSLASLEMDFEALQSELIGFKFYSLQKF